MRLGLIAARHLTRRRGDAEEDAEKTTADQNLRTRRKWRDVGWRHEHVSTNGKSISAVSAALISVCFLRAFLRVSAPPRQNDILTGAPSGAMA